MFSSPEQAVLLSRSNGWEAKPTAIYHIYICILYILYICYLLPSQGSNPGGPARWVLGTSVLSEMSPRKVIVKHKHSCCSESSVKQGDGCNLVLWAVPILYLVISALHPKLMVIHNLCSWLVSLDKLSISPSRNVVLSFSKLAKSECNKAEIHYCWGSFKCQTKDFGVDRWGGIRGHRIMQVLTYSAGWQGFFASSWKLLPYGWGLCELPDSWVLWSCHRQSLKCVCVLSHVQIICTHP